MYACGAVPSELSAVAYVLTQWYCRVNIGSTPPIRFKAVRV